MIEIIPNWHPLLVHFTVALLSLAVLVHLAVLLPLPAGVRAEGKVVARWLLWLGALFAIATAATGWLAYNSVEHDDISHAAMTVHRNWALTPWRCSLGKPSTNKRCERQRHPAW